MRKLSYFLLAAVAVVLTACGEEPTIDDNGALKGRFTVDYKGTQVQFSRGNLQYQNCTNTWRFAEYQWSFVGGAGEGNVIDELSGVLSSNMKAADKGYTGWIDLFGWGTGNAPTEISEDNADYPKFVDWGTNAISNGGNKANMWRTLAMEEWVYLFCSRKNANTLWGLGKVNGIRGMILLPDDWALPKDVSFTASATNGLSWDGANSYYVNDEDNNYSHNSYSAKTWAVMEDAGAVFLPAACYRFSNTQLSYYCGWYWSASPRDVEKAYSTGFNSKYFYPQNPSNRFFGFSVRLVQDLK